MDVTYGSRNYTFRTPRTNFLDEVALSRLRRALQQCIRIAGNAPESCSIQVGSPVSLPRRTIDPENDISPGSTSRRALLRAVRRGDMYGAVTSGPRLRRGRSHEPLDKSLLVATAYPDHKPVPENKCARPARTFIPSSHRDRSLRSAPSIAKTKYVRRCALTTLDLRRMATSCRTNRRVNRPSSVVAARSTFYRVDRSKRDTVSPKCWRDCRRRHRRRARANTRTVRRVENPDSVSREIHRQGRWKREKVTRKLSSCLARTTSSGITSRSSTCESRRPAVVKEKTRGERVRVNPTIARRERHVVMLAGD